MTEQQALQRYAVRQDAEAFRQLVEQYQHLVYAAASRRLAHLHDVEEVVQLTFLKLAQNARTIRRDLAAWLYVTAINAANELIRRDATRRRHEALAAVPEEAGNEEMRRQWQRLSVMVDEAIEELQAEERSLLVEHFFLARSQRELAASVGASQTTIRRKLEAAVEHLRVQLAARGWSGAPAMVPGVLAYWAQVKAPAALGVNLVKIGLAGSGAAAGGSGMTTGLAAKSVGKTAAAGVLLVAASVTAWWWMGGGSAAPPAAGVPATGAAAPGATTAVATRAEIMRTRELIYQLRYSAITGPTTQETYEAIRELVQIGAPAVPDLCAELDRSERDSSLRAIGFTLRAINDRRAVPALIRALPRTAVAVSDFGGMVLDAEVWQFITDNRLPGSTPDAYPGVGIRRANREITAALERMTGYSVGRASQGGASTDAPDAMAAATRLRQEDADRWQSFWNEHAEGLLSAEEREAMTAPAGDGDAVEAAGAARYGALFPTGAGVRLGPVREITLESEGAYDARAYIDFDTGRVYTSREYGRDLGSDEYKFGRWCRQVGVDAWADGQDRYEKKVEPPPPTGNALRDIGAAMAAADSSDRGRVVGHDFELTDGWCRTWAVENARWDTIEEETKKSEPLNVGKWGPGGNFVPRDLNGGPLDYRHYEYPATFLFITREGARGILQVLGTQEDPLPVLKLRYRVYEAPATAPALVPEPAAPAGVAFSPVKTVKLGDPRGKDLPAALDFDSGNARLGEAGLLEGGVPPANLGEWLAAWKGDGIVQTARMGERLFAINCEGAITENLSTGSWENCSASELYKLAARKLRHKKGEINVPFLRTDPTVTQPKPATFLIITREGGTGIVQVLEAEDTGKEAQALTVRYKMIAPHP